MINIFYNRYQRRLRSGWRVLIYFVLFFGTIALTSIITKILIPNQIIRSIITSLVILALSLGVLWLGGHYLDHRRFKDYGFHFSKRWWLDFLFGIILSALLIYIVFCIEKAMGWITIVDYFQNQREGYLGMPFFVPLLMGLIFFIIVGLYEEIIFRAYVITNLSEGLHKKKSESKKALTWVYILSSIIFGLLHSGNPNITLLGTINIVLLGLVLGLSYILSGELAMPIALHISWNFIQSIIFGFPVSGEYHHVSVIAIEQHGSSIWTGGAFGPEGGLVGTIALVIGGIFVFLWFKILQRPVTPLQKRIIFPKNLMNPK